MGPTAMDSSFEQVGGLRVHYLHGGAGPPLVLLHGGLLSSEMGLIRGPYEPSLTSQHRLVVPDARGHGQTINPGGDLSYQELARDVIGLCAALGLDRPAIWGFSDGANVALEVGLQAPDLPRALVLHAAETVWSAEGIAAASAFFFMSPGAPPDTDRMAAEHPEFVSMFQALHASQGRDHWRTLVRDSYKMWITPIDYSPADFASVRAPTLVACGDRDEFLSTDDQVRLFRQLPNAELAILPGLGHDFLRPSDVDVVLEFLARH